VTAPVAIDALDAVELAEMLELLCDWIDGAPEVLGKSLARFLGAGYALGALVRRHRADDSTSRAIKRIMRAELIVIDDIGLLPVASETAEALYRVVDAAYERRALAISSNLHPSGFDELMPKTIANATVDRLLHHAHVVLTAGDSIRLTQATRGKGVKALAV
jgi:hypothetical protein